MFKNCDFMLAFLRERNTSQSVIDVFNDLYTSLGADCFKFLFPVLLGDYAEKITMPKNPIQEMELFSLKRFFRHSLSVQSIKRLHNIRVLPLLGNRSSLVICFFHGFKHHVICGECVEACSGGHVFMTKQLCNNRQRNTPFLFFLFLLLQKGMQYGIVN